MTLTLVVDDNKVNRLVLNKSLNRLNCIVSEAEDGKKAIIACQEQDFDLIFMDMQMPELDGVSTTKILRESKLKTPIIALTANASQQDRELCLSSGMNNFLSRPVRKSELISIMQEYL